MTFDPQHFLNIARQLIDDGHHEEEVRYRTAISRAYYAAHLMSKKKLEDIGIYFQIEEGENTGIIHKMVIDYFKNIENPIGDWLLDLRQNRNRADYNLSWEFKKYGVKLLIDEAENVINDLHKLKKQRKKTNDK